MLEFLGATAEGYNDWHLVAMTPFSTPVLVVLALLLLVALLISSRALKRASRKAQALLLSLRLTAAAVVLALLLQPGVELLATVRERGRLAVLIDASQSMALRDGTRLRWDRAQEIVATLEPQLKKLQQRFDLEVYRFGQDVTPVTSMQAAVADPPGATQTDILKALAAVAPGQKRRPLGGVLLLSDGADNSQLATYQQNLAQPVVDALDAPLLAVAIGDASLFRDLSIDDIVADDFAFVRNEVEIEAVIRVSGIDARTVPVTLREGGQVVAVSQLQVDPSKPTQRASFRFVPTKTGKKTFVVEVPLLDREAIAENNRRSFTLKVIRDRIRVLQVAGRPSWDERFLRRLLKANPSVDLISFFILRTQSDVAGRPEELSLIPFPTEELFTKELKTFDIVIFQNFNYRPYHMGLYLSNIRDFVIEQGGGFAMVGGDLSFSEGGYQITPLVDILPVQLQPTARQYQRNPYRPVVTEVGRSHPILELNRGDISALLQSLPQLRGFNMSAGLADNAQCLLQHPFERSGPNTAPIVATREVGRGRSLAVMTDDTWYWSLPDAGAGGRGTAHRRFWANALRWLIRDPALSRVRVESTRRSYDPGTPVEIRLRAFDTAYRPESGAEIKIEVVQEDQASQKMVLKQASVADKDGEVILRLPPQPPGNYRIKAQAISKNGVSLGSDDEVFVLRAASPERTAAQPRPDLLRQLAELSGGELLEDPEDIGDDWLRDAERVTIHRAKRVAIWDNIFSLLLLVAIVGTEWWLRRRWGFS